MKYCPYCGAELFEKTASFCTECGREISVGNAADDITKKEQNEKTHAKNKKQKRSKIAFAKRKMALLEEERIPEQPKLRNDYDGYYSDVIPSDYNHEKEVVNKGLIKKIAVIAGVMLLIIGLCVVAMYLL